MRKLLLSFIGTFLIVGLALAQDRTVTGRVTADDGSFLPGVSVQVKSTTRGTTTDASGNYRIEASANDVLVFSFVGFAPLEETVGNRSTINVSLDSDTRLLEEAVIVGYGTQSRKTLTGAQSNISAEKIENTPLPSVDQALQGKVAGLQSLSSSGQPGAAQQIRIRGIGSITASSEPLYVVDGIPINAGDQSRLTTSTNALAGINPTDIESITVLKDAASASIYGSRGGNGVILITTKKGRNGKTRFKVDAENGVTNIALNDQARPLSRDEYLMLTTEGLRNIGRTEAQINTTLNSLGANAMDPQNPNMPVSTDWYDLVTRQGTQQQYNISASGGDNKTQFFASTGYYQQTAPVIGSDFDRISGNVNVTHNATKKLSFKIGVNLGHTKSTAPNAGGAFANPILSSYFLLPTRPAYDANGDPNYSQADFPSIYNPVALVAFNKRRFANLRGLGNIGADYRILNNLTFSTKLGLDANSIEELQYDNPFFGDGRNTNGRSFTYYTRSFNWNWTNILDYRLDLSDAKDIYLDLKLGYEAQKSKLYGISAQGQGFPPTTDLILPNVAATPTTASAFGSDYSFNSILSNAAFNYKDRYSLSGSFRRDGSSRFGSNNRYGNFWSVGAAWNLDEEAFLKESSLVSSAKLRASYGVNGNAGIGNYEWQATYGFGRNYNKQPGSAPDGIGNSNLTWEQNKPFDVGLDLGLFNNRLSFIVDYYIRKTDRLLLRVPLSRTSGFADILDNVGSMENRGLEFTVNGTPFEGPFTWDLNFNISFNKNKILNLAEGQDEYIDGAFIRRVGENFTSFYARDWAGVDPQTGAPQWWKDAAKTEKTTVYNDAERVIVGQAMPNAFGGLSSVMRFKGFTLDAQLNFVTGNSINAIWARYTESDGWNPSFNKSRKLLERWQNPGDITNVPKYVYNNTTNSQEYSSRFIYDGSYMRLRTVTLTYALPKTLTGRIKMDNVSVFARGLNLWTYTFDDEVTFDPEVGVDGRNNLNVFIPKTMTFGLSLGF
ncbi:SusC/RagA family TonB-linked outer membrane protein [Persicitalea jodogahamensis]|uniref:SusC/RagA family TonB-linked outer membrane protein n=1 Tax=Persicitalea jodogahamensis TaxID=402147 RepID=A0A8J3GA97_9BACT|nr:TonB-dependent receptor [Persicitalea jodogahamensis]GHB68885.1 SusC/RagA family TonB-linked outer membrane protein [Persicitalea jodogahamensis]